MFPRKTRRALGFVCAVMLAVGQLAASAYACPQSAPGAVASAAAEAGMSPDCAEEMGSKPSPICKAHCDQSSQTSQTPTVAVPPVALLALWTLAPLGETEAAVPATRHTSAAPDRPGAAPPLRIQHQVFRN